MISQLCVIYVHKLDIFSIEYAFSVDITRFFDALNHTSVNISRFFDALNHISVNISRFFDAQVKNQSISIGFCNHNFFNNQYQYNFWLKYINRFRSVSAFSNFIKVGNSFQPASHSPSNFGIFICYFFEKKQP